MALPVDALGYVSYAHGAGSRRAGLRAVTPMELLVDAPGPRVVRPWRCRSTHLGRVSYARGAAGRRAGPRVVRPWRCRSTRWAACRTPVALPVDVVRPWRWAAWAACRTPVALPVDALGRVVVRPWRCRSTRWAACRTPVALPVDALGRVSYARGAAGRRVGRVSYARGAAGRRTWAAWSYARGAAGRRAGLRVVRPVWNCVSRFAGGRCPGLRIRCLVPVLLGRRRLARPASLVSRSW